MRALVMVAAIAFATPAIGQVQSPCGRPDTICMQVQRTRDGAALSTPDGLPRGHLEGVSINRESEWRALIRSCRDLLRDTASTDTAGARLREGCTAFGVRSDSTDAELDAITPF
jgi:hypothetical protein